MDEEVKALLQNIIKRFNGMQFTPDMVEYLAMEVNDATKRLYPDFARDYYIDPEFTGRIILFKSHRLH